MPYNGAMTCNHCDNCNRQCGCPEPFLGIKQLPDYPSYVRFNMDGKTEDFDFGPVVTYAQTDTSLVADVINRILTYTAERHKDTITAQELGAILHLGDLGDVDSKKADQGSMLVYQRNNNCAEGCMGTQNRWVVWNALDNTNTGFMYPMGFDAQGTAWTLRQPANTSQSYLLGWNGQSQVSYTQPTTVASAPLNTNGKKLALYLDPITKAIVAVEE